MAVGYAAAKLKVMDSVSDEKLTKIVINIALPALTISSVSDVPPGMGAGELGYIFLYSFIVFAILALISIALPLTLRAKKTDLGTYQFMTMFGNVAFMGYPVISAIFGTEAIFYCAALNIVFGLLVFSVGITMIAGGGKKFNPKLLINTPLISSLIAVILFLLKVELPTLLISCLDKLGGVTTPAAMLLLGSVISRLPIKELFTEWRIYPFTLVKLIVSPILVWLILRNFIANDMVLGALVVLSGMPVATNATMLCIEYGGNQELVSKGIFLTTVLSMATIPIMAYLFF